MIIICYVILIIFIIYKIILGYVVMLLKGYLLLYKLLFKSI